ncbi:YdcF family protein [Ruminococcus sp. 5_1_39BFAA]|uniref:YdcF family protein n=1 Tax=Ruminococcus sp. 5_1_39BFAA TaxID=457412 RepID=UPI00356A05C7
MAIFLFFAVSQYSEQLVSHDWIIGILTALFVITVSCVLAFPGLLIVMFFVEGIKVIRHEGIKPSNLLSMLFSLLLYAYLAIWPGIGDLTDNTFGTMLYVIVSFSAIYILSLMSMYSFSAVLNLIHLKKDRDADYIVVLGSGINGTRVTPLLTARIEKGIDLLSSNPNAALIMSGGQGPGEDIPESEAMAAYAIDRGVDKERIIMEAKSVSTQENLLFSRRLMEKEKPKIVIVTTAYHVFRALLLAKQQGIKCVGFGAKTKWYFTLNALLREFAGYLRLTWKKHAAVIGTVSCVIIVAKLIVWLK